MKVVVLFVVLCGVALVASELQVPIDVAHFNEHDEVVGFSQRMVPESLMALAMRSASRVATGTPAELSKAISKQFGPGSPTIHWKFPTFTRPASLKTWCGCNVQVTYNVHDRKPQPFHDPCKLPVGNFTFVLTADNQITFGSPADVMEWGTKHVHMANMRPGYGAGEITIANENDKRVIRWNLKSGCYSRLLSEQNGLAYNGVLHAKIANVWNASTCAADFHFQTDPLLTEGPPSVDEIVDICKEIGRNHFNYLSWTQCIPQLTKYLENETLCMDYWHLPKCLPFESEEKKDENHKSLMSIGGGSPMLSADTIEMTVPFPTETVSIETAVEAAPVVAPVVDTAVSSSLLTFLSFMAVAIAIAVIAAVTRLRAKSDVMVIGEPTSRALLASDE